MDKIVIMRNIRPEVNDVRYVYNMLDRKFLYRASKMFCIIDNKLIYIPVFRFKIVNVDNLNFEGLKCELFTDSNKKAVTQDIVIEEDSVINVAFPRILLPQLTEGNIYTGRLVGENIDIEFNYEVRGDIYAPI